MGGVRTISHQLGNERDRLLRYAGSNCGITLRGITSLYSGAQHGYRTCKQTCPACGFVEGTAILGSDFGPEYRALVPIPAKTSSTWRWGHPPSLNTKLRGNYRYSRKFSESAVALVDFSCCRIGTNDRNESRYARCVCRD